MQNVIESSRSRKCLYFSIFKHGAPDFDIHKSIFYSTTSTATILVERK